MLTLAFFVKFPIYYVHLWLPKAHVEAPVTGSIILAAVLLKLGGFGLWRCRVFFLINKIVLIFLIISLVGAGVISFICVRQTDIKVLIAYSSVAHIRIVVARILFQHRVGFFSGIIIIIAHGISSSAIFAGAHLIYLCSNSRNIILSCSLLRIIPIFSLLWFVLCLGNMRTPPTINFFSEVYCLISIYPSSYWIIFPLRVLRFLRVVYTLLLYASTQQGRAIKFRVKAKSIVRRVLCVIAFHVLWLFRGLIYYFYFCVKEIYVNKFVPNSIFVSGNFFTSIKAHCKYGKEFTFWVWIPTSLSASFTLFFTFFFSGNFVFSLWYWVDYFISLFVM